jgi:hypothetical protein
MPRCLYCHETKDITAFNREHVIPEAFGTFEGNFVLKGVVCTACNKHFGDHLDIKLARDSIEGLDRYEHGLKSPTEKTKFGRTPFLTARVNDGSFYQGAEIWWGPSDNGDKVVMRPFPQIGFEDASGKDAWFRVGDIPTKLELQALGFVLPVTIKFFGIEATELADAERRLVERGFTLSPMERGEGPSAAEIDIDIKGTIDRVLMRAVAKVAYNYLAFHYAGIAAMEQFDAVRRYIRYDDAPSGSPVSLSSGDFLAGLPADRAPVAYGVGVSWRDGRVVGQVTFFFRFHYRVVLADGGFLIAPTTIGKGHLFNPINRQIVELTPDPRKGKPLPPPAP